jgi:ATP phosphoribosyltransferase
MFRIFFADLIRLLQPPTTLKMAEDELEQAKRELLKAHTAEEYAHHMANYHADRIDRLTKFINQQKEPSCQSSPSNYGTAEHVQNQQNKTSTSNSVATLKRL